MKKETLVTTVGRDPKHNYGAVNPPVYRTSTIIFPTLADFDAASKGQYPFSYGRAGTQATVNLEAALAEINEAEHAIVTCSGLAAIHVAIAAMLSSGDHLLVTDNVYGSTRALCKNEIARMGIEVTYFDPMTQDITPLLKKNTKMVYCETPGSLTFEVQDIPAIAKAAHAHGAVVAVDNTWATQFFYDAMGKGADIVIQSCTKYVSGHSDLVMGLITCSKKHYPALRRTYVHFGACPGSEEVYLAARGLRTMAMRLKQNQASALKLAQWLKQRPEVTKVLHPAFPECPGHEIWKRDFKGASGLFAVLLKPYPRDRLAAMLDNMELFGMGWSWGGYESLVIPLDPVRTATKWPQDCLGLRIYAGLEEPDDLIADLEAGFKRLNA